ncbi:DUF3649 domain-containing protein [Bradyrhizobium cenepequi]
MAHVAAGRKQRGPGVGLLSAMLRALAGIGCGYLLASTVAIVLAKALPMSRLDAVLTGAMGSFAVYVCAMLWAFIASSTLRAWLGIAVPTLILAALGWLMG